MNMKPKVLLSVEEAGELLVLMAQVGSKSCCSRVINWRH